MLGEAEIVVRAQINSGRGLQGPEQAFLSQLRQPRSGARLQRRWLHAGTADSRIPKSANRRLSASCSGFGVVSNFSPRKTELAPARKQRACASALSASRPALNRTID